MKESCIFVTGEKKEEKGSEKVPRRILWLVRLYKTRLITDDLSGQGPSDPLMDQCNMYLFKILDTEVSKHR